jgi:hypothetical protein
MMQGRRESRRQERLSEFQSERSAVSRRPVLSREENRVTMELVAKLLGFAAYGPFFKKPVFNGVMVNGEKKISIFFIRLFRTRCQTNIRSTRINYEGPGNPDGCSRLYNSSPRRRLN